MATLPVRLEVMSSRVIFHLTARELLSLCQATGYLFESIGAGEGHLGSPQRYWTARRGLEKLEASAFQIAISLTRPQATALLDLFSEESNFEEELNQALIKLRASLRRRR